MLKILGYILIILLLNISLAEARNIYSSELDPVLLEEANEFLPADGKIDTNVMENSNTNTIKFEEDIELWARFIWEGSGHKNSFGYYSKEDDGTIKKETLLYDSTSVENGGTLSSGDYFKIGDFSTGDEIGFFISGNGYSESKKENSGASRHIYFSEQEMNHDGVDHMLSAKSTETGELILGFEELYNGGDRDYNDLVFSIFSTNRSSLFRAVSSEVTVSGNQALLSATGNVTMNVAMFARLQMPDLILLTNRDLNFGQNVLFSGIDNIEVESNCGVIVSFESTPISNGVYSYPTVTRVNNTTNPFYTEAAKTHKGKYIIEISTIVDDFTKAESGEYLGTVTVTLSAY